MTGFSFILEYGVIPPAPTTVPPVIPFWTHPFLKQFFDTTTIMPTTVFFLNTTWSEYLLLFVGIIICPMKSAWLHKMATLDQTDFHRKIYTLVLDFHNSTDLKFSQQAFFKTTLTLGSCTCIWITHLTYSRGLL